MRALLLLLIVATAQGAWAAPPAAATTTWGGALPFDPLWERVIFGAPPVPDVRTLDAGVVDARGRFANVGGALRLAEPADVGESTWMTSATLSDGLVRARFVVGSKLDASLVVRGQLGPRGELVDGYAVSVEKDVLRLYRYRHQLPRWLGAEAKLDLPTGTVVEIVLVMNGPFLDATVFDGVSLQPRGRVFARDRAFAHGRIGVRFHRSQDEGSGLILLSVGAAGMSVPELAAADEGAGPERLAIFPSSQIARLPADLKARVLETRPGGDGAAESTLVTDVLGLERAKRAGIVPRLVSAEVPWKFVDPVLRSRLGKPPSTTMSGLRVDEGYKDADAVEAVVRAYAARFPHLARLEEIGRSLEGRPVLALKISKNPHVDEDEDSVLLDAGHHGGELMSIEFALDAVQQLLERYKRDPAITAMVDGLAIWVVPLVNPDGNMRFIHVSRDHDRKNGRDVDGNGPSPTDGVDLYRNYPVRHGALGEVGSRSLPQHSKYRGEEAASEPEVRAMMALAERERFVASIDFHTNGTLLLVPYTDPGMTNPEPNEAWTVAEEIAALLPVQVNGKKYAVQRNMYPVDGTCQDWLRFAHGTVAFLVEGPTHNPLPYSRGRPAAVVGTRPTWTGLFTRVLDGPGVVVRVRDEAGTPVQAEVVVAEMAPRMGESWTTRPRDGRMRRLLPGAGAYTVKVRAPGFVDETRRVSVGEAETANVVVKMKKAGP